MKNPPGIGTGKPGRQGLTEDDVRQAITQLQTNDQKITPTRVRDLLGSGSFTTISRVIAAWREEQLTSPQLNVPKPPQNIANALTQVWQQAWISAHSSFDTERRGFATEKAAFAKDRDELLAEIGRLEATLEQFTTKIADVEQTRSHLHNELAAIDRDKAKLQGQLETLSRELLVANQERQHATSQLTAWIERATRAESRLAQLNTTENEERSS